MPSGPAHLCPCLQSQLYWASYERCRICSPEGFSRWWAEKFLPSVASCEGQGSLCTFLSSWPSVESGSVDINIDHSCNRDMNPDMGPGSIPGPDITMAQDCKQVTHASPLFTASTSSDVPLSTEHASFCLISFLIPHCTFAHHNSAAVGRPVFPSLILVAHPRHARGSPCSTQHVMALGRNILSPWSLGWTQHWTFLKF